MSKTEIRSAQWIDKGDHYHLSIGGELQRCVSCNRPLEHDKRSYKANHHCPDDHEAHSVAANHAHDELGILHTRSEGELIADGFEMLRGDDV